MNDETLEERAHRRRLETEYEFGNHDVCACGSPYVVAYANDEPYCRKCWRNMLTDSE